MKINDTKSRKPSEGLYRKRDTSVLGSKFSIYSSANKEELYHVDIEKIKEFEGQARQHFDEESIDSLAKSIKEHGIRSPLTLLRKDNDLLEVVSGERRLRAAKKVGLKKVPAFILEDKDKAENLAVIENVQREDLHPIEFGHACKRLLEKGICKTKKEISENIGISNTVVIESIGFTEIPEEIKSYLINNKISSRAALRVLKNKKTVEECKKYLGISGYKENKINNTRSLLRIELKNGKLVVSSLKHSLLSPSQKNSLKTSLENIINQIKI